MLQGERDLSTVSNLIMSELAPLVNALAVQGVTRAGALITLTPTITGADVTRVEYTFGTVSHVASVAPFAASITVPGGVPDFSVTVRAIDEVGNRSEALVRTIPVAVRTRARS